MADHRTVVTELVTGLGTLGFDDLESALAARPAEMASLSPERWDLLADLHRGGGYRQEFVAAWQNGRAFLDAADGLRGRRPLLIEWRGGQRQPGDEPVPADLRIDHVYLVSCKYLSQIVTNSSPATVFDRLLAGGHGGRSADWFAEVAPTAYDDLYRTTLAWLGNDLHGLPARAADDDVGPPASPATAPAPGLAGHGAGVGGRGADGLGLPAGDDGPGSLAGPARALAPGLAGHGVGGLGPDGLGLPGSVLELTPGDRAVLQQRLGKGRWARELRPAALAFSTAVAEASAERWRKALADADLERVLWRLLRIGAAPYFVLGASPEGSLRLRIGTAWDWRQHFRIDDFTVTPTAREQPVVQWAVAVTNRRSCQTSVVEGHVEIRWSHGKFAQRPEAKVYLDTPHHRVPGYWPLA
jgi:hypothetical protein